MVQIHQQLKLETVETTELKFKPLKFLLTRILQNNRKSDKP